MLFLPLALQQVGMRPTAVLSLLPSATKQIERLGVPLDTLCPQVWATAMAPLAAATMRRYSAAPGLACQRSRFARWQLRRQVQSQPSGESSVSSQSRNHSHVTCLQCVLTQCSVEQSGLLEGGKACRHHGQSRRAIQALGKRRL